MWYKNENGDLTKPESLDNTSSSVYVYIRKEFKQIPEIQLEDQIIPAHWEWLEMKVKKEDWYVFNQVMDNTSALDDVYTALTELASIIEGGE